MLNRRGLLFATFTGVAAPLAAAVAQPHPPGRPPMPPPRMEHRPPPPRGPYHWAWRQGHWRWDGRRWIWAGGGWYH